MNVASARARPFGRVLRGVGARLLLTGALLTTAPALGIDPARDTADLVVTGWRDELPQETVSAVLQSRDGYLWLGTYEGLVRFDGVRFEVFDSRNVPAMRRSAVLCLAEDQRGVLWIGTQGGGLLRMENGRFEAWTTARGLLSDEVYALHVDRWNAVFAGTGRGVCRLSGGRLERWGDSHGLGGGPVVAFAQGQDGTLWAGSNGGGLHAFGAGGWRAVGESPAGPAISSLVVDGDGGLWIGSRSGLHHLAGAGRRSWGQADGLPSPLVSALLLDREGSLWVGTHGEGLLRFRDGAFGRVGFPEAHASDYVRSLVEDREGNVWAGTRGGLLRIKESAFTTVREGLQGEIARTVFQDSRGRILVGVEGSGLHVVDGRRATRLADPSGTAAALIRSIGEDAAGGLWVGTAGNGAVRIEGGRAAVHGVGDGLAGDNVRVVLGRPDGSVWAGTTTGLSVFRGGRWQPSEVSILARAPVHALLFLHDGALAAGTADRGLVVVRDGRAVVYAEPEGLPSRTVFALHEDASGGLWIGTASGLSRLLDGRVTTWHEPGALFGEQVFSILEDDAGFLWFSNNRGVHRISKAGLHAASLGVEGRLDRVVFGPPDGMPARQCNGTSQPAALHAADGRLWYPTSHGLAVIDPSRLRAPPGPPAVLVARVLVDGVPVTAEDGLSLRPGSRRIEVELSGLCFTAPERVRFRYRLVGLDPDWHETTQRVVAFTTLPPGRYRFEASAAADGGTFGGQPAVLQIHVAPRLHQTTLFWSIIAAAGVAVAWSTYLRLKAQERRLSSVVAEKTRALAAEMAHVDEANRRLAESNELLGQMSRSDALTGLANRRLLDESLDTEWRRCARLGLPLSAIMFDIDHFKDFNDAFGHQAGDDCLKRVAAELSAGIRRAGDLVARYGGEEFVALLPGTGDREAMELAEQARASIEALRIPHVESESVVTISGGVATVVPGEGTVGDLAQAADAALYEAKRAGRNRVVKSSGPGRRSGETRTGPIRI